MKTIKKIVFKNVLGITEQTLEPAQINIIEGKKGTGKTSLLDAINSTLSNQKVRTEIIKNGEKEASLYIELSDGTIIDRKKHLEKNDSVCVKKDNVINSPESYLKNLFDTSQFRPINFIEKSVKEQNKILLSLVDIKWSMEDIINWFGETPQGIDYSTHILNILDDIQSKKGIYYTTREDLNREIRNKKAIAEDILKSVPDGYSANNWRIANLSNLFGKVIDAQNHNKKVDENNSIIDNYPEKIIYIENKYSNIESAEINRSNEIIANHYKKINDLEKELIQIKNDLVIDQGKLLHFKENNQKNKELELQELNSKLSETKEKKLEYIDIIPLKEAAEHAEKMKSFLNEYDNALSIHSQIKDLETKSNKLTQKIEFARNLPAQLLQEANLSVKGITIKDGIPLINGLPIQNLSTGEQLELAVEIAKLTSGELGVILVDRLESLDRESQDIFIQKCIESGLQFFMTKVTDNEYNIVKL